MSPAAVAWAQLLTMGLIVAWTLKRLREWGLAREWAWAASILIGAMPAAGIMCITLWKDVPYTEVFLVLNLIVLHIIHSRGEWLRRPWAVVADSWHIARRIGGFYRHNGLPLAVSLRLLRAVELGLPTLLATSS